MRARRELAAAVAIPVVLAILFLTPPIVFHLLVAAVTLCALWEFYRLTERTGYPVAKTVGMVGGLLVCLQIGLLLLVRPTDVFGHGPSLLGFVLSVPLGLIALALLAAAAPLFAGVDVSVGLGATASTVLGVLVITLPAMSFSYLRNARPAENHFGSRAVLFLLLLVWVCDSCAYYLGSRFGKHRLAPVVSPKKTWEGSIAGLIGASAFGAAAGTWWVLPEFGPVRGALAGALASTAGQLGDLVESMWKRGAGVKDSGTFLPGHGGFYDRIDSLLFAGPVLAAFVGALKA